MILNNGLGQALAFLKASDELAAELLYGDLQNWLCDDPSVKTPPMSIYKGEGLIEALIAGNRSDYLLAQQEALRLITWMKKFADAFLPKGTGND